MKKPTTTNKRSDSQQHVDVYRDSLQPRIRIDSQSPTPIKQEVSQISGGVSTSTPVAYWLKKAGQSFIAANMVTKTRETKNSLH